MLTFIVFLSSSLLLVVQLASAQLTPRIIGVVFRDRVTRFALTLFAFTFTFTLAVLVRIHTSVPAITAHLAAYLCLLSVASSCFSLIMWASRCARAGPCGPWPAWGTR